MDQRDTDAGYPEEEEDLVQIRTHQNRRGQRQSVAFSQKVRQSFAAVQEAFLDDRILSFITLKVFLWDIVISVADISSDFVQGYTLFVCEERRVYGIISLCINWVPGLAASIHVLSTYRTIWPWYKVVLYAILVLVLYPVVPLASFIYLLYKKPKTNKDPITKEFEQAQNNCTIVHAITGGLDRDIQ